MWITEYYNGTGYPDSLSAEQIPLGARILAVADTYDALTYRRIPRSAMGEQTAYAEIEYWSGIQFDPKVIDAFLRTRASLSLLLDANVSFRHPCHVSTAY